MAELAGVTTTLAEGVVTLTLDRPPVNALSVAGLRAIRAEVEGAPADAHGLVLRARGRGFGAGNDVRDFPDDSDAYRAHVSEVQAMLEATHRCPLLTVALVHGFCVGSSALLAAACDVVVASRSAWFRFPEMEIGAPGGYRLLIERMSPTSAREVLVSCRRVGAEEAQVLGLVDRVVDEDDLDSAADDYLRDFGPAAAWDGVALVGLKSELDRVSQLPLWRGYAEELDHGARMRSARRKPTGGQRQ